jgi:hypothetical protein
VSKALGAALQFGYWADEQNFVKNDYTSFFPLDYPGIFKVASQTIVKQYVGRHYEIRLQEV